MGKQPPSVSVHVDIAIAASSEAPEAAPDFVERARPSGRARRARVCRSPDRRRPGPAPTPAYGLPQTHPTRLPPPRRQHSRTTAHGAPRRLPSRRRLYQPAGGASGPSLIGSAARISAVWSIVSYPASASTDRGLASGPLRIDGGVRALMRSRKRSLIRVSRRAVPRSSPGAVGCLRSLSSARCPPFLTSRTSSARRRLSARRATRPVQRRCPWVWSGLSAFVGVDDCDAAAVVEDESFAIGRPARIPR